MSESIALPPAIAEMLLSAYIRDDRVKSSLLSTKDEVDLSRSLLYESRVLHAAKPSEGSGIARDSLSGSCGDEILE